jgi:hypothetical protein
MSFRPSSETSRLTSLDKSSRLIVSSEDSVVGMTIKTYPARNIMVKNTVSWSTSEWSGSEPLLKKYLIDQNTVRSKEASVDGDFNVN